MVTMALFLHRCRFGLDVIRFYGSLCRFDFSTYSSWACESPRCCGRSRYYGPTPRLCSCADLDIARLKPLMHESAVRAMDVCSHANRASSKQVVVRSFVALMRTTLQSADWRTPLLLVHQIFPATTDYSAAHNRLAAVHCCGGHPDSITPIL